MFFFFRPECPTSRTGCGERAVKCLKMRIESKERRTAASTLAGELISGVSWLSNEMTEMSCFACKQDDG